MLTFILSTGRTGTTFLNNSLENFPDVTSCQERNFRSLRILSNKAFITNRHSFLTEMAVKKMVIEPIQIQAKKSDYHFEINPPLFFCLDKIIKEFPDANFIHIVRNPIDYIDSSINWTDMNRLNKLMKLYFPFWEVKPRDFYFKDNEDKIFKSLIYKWKKINSLLSQISLKTDRYHLIKFEDVFLDPEEGVKSILKISNYKNHEKVSLVNKKKLNKSYKKKNISQQRLNYIYKHCGNLMKEYGYDISASLYLDK